MPLRRGGGTSPELPLPFSTLVDLPLIKPSALSLYIDAVRHCRTARPQQPPFRGTHYRAWDSFESCQY